MGKLFNRPIATQTRILVLERMDYPAVTFCYKNADGVGYDNDILKVRILGVKCID